LTTAVFFSGSLVFFAIWPDSSPPRWFEHYQRQPYYANRHKRATRDSQQNEQGEQCDDARGKMQTPIASSSFFFFILICGRQKYESNFPTPQIAKNPRHPESRVVSGTLLIFFPWIDLTSGGFDFAAKKPAVCSVEPHNAPEGCSIAKGDLQPSRNHETDRWGRRPFVSTRPLGHSH